MSIVRFLLLMLLAIITLVSFSAALSGYRLSTEKANEVFDQNLSNFAEAIAVLPAVKTEIQTDQKRFAFQIWRDDNLMVRNTLAPEEAISLEDSGFGASNFGGQRWRTYRLNSPTNGHTIMVSEPYNVRLELAEELAISSMAPLVFATLGLAILIGLTIRQGLSPLKDLSYHLRSKVSDDFNPISLKNCPKELQPVQDTINSLMHRVQQAFEREKRFASDAAHELRTPISVLKINLHNIQTDHPELRAEVQQLQDGINRMSHVIEQILLLSRTHPDHFKAGFTQLSAKSLCQTAIAEHFDEIDQKQQKVELLSADVNFQGDEFAIMSLLGNLIGNASKYTPEKGEILVKTYQQNSDSCFVIEDSGPGIPEQDYDRVLDRFYRVHGDQHPSGIIGCGLGMAIVKQVTDLHHGHIQLSHSAKLGGLKVTFSVPCSQSMKVQHMSDQVIER